MSLAYEPSQQHTHATPTSHRLKNRLDLLNLGSGWEEMGESSIAHPISMESLHDVEVVIGPYTDCVQVLQDRKQGRAAVVLNSDDEETALFVVGRLSYYFHITEKSRRVVK